MITRSNRRAVRSDPGNRHPARVAAISGLRGVRVLLVLLLTTLAASARITKSRSSVSATAREGPGAELWWSPLYSITLGAGFEYSSDAEVREYAFPMLVEYQLSDTFLVALEPEYISLLSKTSDEPSLRGWGDLETTLEWEFLGERRYRPALSLEGTLKWPTASHPDLGEPGMDYTLGLIASKELVFVDVDLNVLYTFSGHSERQDNIEAVLAVTWHLNPWLDVIGEVSSVALVGGARGEEEAQRFETEATLGLSWLVSDHLTLEQGIIIKEHGEWQAIFAWEWSFGGD